MKNKEFKIFTGIHVFTSSYVIFVQKIPFKNIFDQNYFISTDSQNFCCTFCEKLNVQLCQENISCRF